MRLYDSKGLYEEYTFNDVVINTLKDIDFSADNPKYGF
jgi:outer membrane lipoprotein-sorting protein